MKSYMISIYDRNRLFREGLNSLLENQKFTVVCCTESFENAIGHDEPSLAPDLVICGLDRDDELPAALRELGHADGGRPKLVLLATAPTAHLLQCAAEAGVHAVLSRNISGEVLQRALEFVLLGERLFPAPDTVRPGVAAAPSVRPAGPIGRSRLHDPTVQLSEREAQILGCLVGGASNKQIARQLGITEATVKVHIKGLLRKLRVNNRTQAAVWGMNNPFATDTNDTPMLRLVETGVPLSIAS